MVRKKDYGLDQFYTNSDMAQKCIDTIDVTKYDIVVEPSAGMGAFYNLIEVIEKIIETKKFKNKTHFFNIGSGKSITIMELAKIIKKRCKSLFSLETKIIKNNKSREIFIKYLYVIKKLKKSKISFSSNYFLKSIDETLKYCYNFKN